MQTVVTLSVASNVPAALVLWEMVSTAQVRTYTVILLYARFIMCTHDMCVPARYSIGLSVS